MRRMVALLLAVVILLAASGCGKQNAGQAQHDKDAASEVSGEKTQNGDEVQEEKTEYPEIALYSEDGAKKAYRMFPYYWLEDEAFDATCEGLLKYGDVVDEVTLFCDNMHAPYMNEDDLERYTTTLTKRIEKLRELGFASVGINMLQTVGHGDYGTGWLDAAPFQAAVDKNGNTSVNQLCPRTEKFLEYITHKYELYAKTNPDFIWVDDDFRVPDKTATYTCFCAACIAEFNKENGCSYTREKLVEALEHDDEDGQILRRQWSEYNGDIYNTGTPETVISCIASASTPLATAVSDTSVKQPQVLRKASGAA